MADKKHHNKEERNVNDTVSDELSNEEETSTRDVDSSEAAESSVENKGETNPPIEPEEDGIWSNDPALIKKLLKDAYADTEKAKKQLLYTQAEFQNYRRRKEEEQKELAKYSNGELLKGLLPVLDNFERALQAAEKAKNHDALIAGVSGTLKQLHAFLTKAGIKPIEAMGKEFDPNYHEAIGHLDSDEFPANTVAEEVQKGYVLDDRVIRPTLVRVSAG